MTEKEIYDSLRKAGLTPEGAAGLMGNLQAESGMKPNNLQNSYNTKLGLTDEEYTALVDAGKYPDFVNDKAGYGLAQWTYHTRKQNLLAFAKQQGKSIGDGQMQLAFLLTELAGYGELWAILNTTSNVDTATDLVLTRFEKPADQGEKVKQTRRGYARAILERCAGAGPVTTATPKTTGADSSLVTVTDWTDKHSGKRSQPISKITIHHMAGIMSAADCMKYHRTASVKASANYYIGKDGEIGQAVKEANGAWTSSSSWNDNRAVTIEVSNSKNGEPWEISGKVYQSLIALCVDICKRNGIKGVSYTGHKEGSLTEHRMFSATTCPGATIHNMLVSGAIQNDINAGLEGKASPETPATLNAAGLVRVTIPDLNVRRGPGTNYDKAGKCPVGVYTITEVRSGKGSNSGWGKLKSGIGWISMDYVTNP